MYAYREVYRSGGLPPIRSKTTLALSEQVLERVVYCELETETMTTHRDSLRNFDSARRKAFVQRILAFITRQPLDLLPFEQVRQQLRLRDRHFRDLQEIPLNQIVGSVGRYRDFTRTFLPRSDGLRERWAAVEDRVKAGGLPPVELYKVGEAYFVRDGNHRISVARAQNVPDIEAFVWEYPSLVPLSPDDDLDDLLIKQGYVAFLEKTRLNRLRPNQHIELTAPGRYRDLLEHIAVHRYYLGREYNRETSNEEAVTGWYDNVYQPIIRAICKQGILKQFLGRTEADLYIWVSRWQHELSERYGKPIDAEDAVINFYRTRET